MQSLNTLFTPSGLPVPVVTPNTVIGADAFYISFNDRDAAIYGGDTTALVYGQMEVFYILNGDHRAAYAPLTGEGFDACFAYFKANSASMNKFSDLP